MAVMMRWQSWWWWWYCGDEDDDDDGEYEDDDDDDTKEPELHAVDDREAALQPHFWQALWEVDISTRGREENKTDANFILDFFFKQKTAYEM